MADAAVTRASGGHQQKRTSAPIAEYQVRGVRSVIAALSRIILRVHVVDAPGGHGSGPQRIGGSRFTPRSPASFEPTGIAAVREHGLDERETGARGFEGELSPVTALDIGGVNADREQPPIRVGQDVALAAKRLVSVLKLPRLF